MNNLLLAAKTIDRRSNLNLKFSSNCSYLKRLSTIGRHCWLNMTKDNMVELAAQQILEYNISLFSLEIIPNLSGDLF